MTRRNLGLGAVGAAAAGLGLSRLFGGEASAAREGEVFPVNLSEDEWKKRLSAEQFYVLREHGTERAGTSPLDREKRAGTFTCAGCDTPLFTADTKFDSGTGWPSFYDALPGGVGYSEDRKLFTVRTEEHCARCGGHLGHVFDDGPAPTGKRHCINGVALSFKPAQA